MFRLYTTLQQNDGSNSRFLANLWPWVKVKANYTGIKMQGLVMAIIKESLKEIGS